MHESSAYACARDCASSLQTFVREVELQSIFGRSTRYIAVEAVPEGEPADVAIVWRGTITSDEWIQVRVQSGI